MQRERATCETQVPSVDLEALVFQGEKCLDSSIHEFKA